MKYIREYQVFEASVTAAALTPEQIEWLDKCADGEWKLNRQTGLVDIINGNFWCREQRLIDFKGVKFGKVSGGFYCSDNQLTTLVGAPQEVGGYFYCQDNQLTSLVGAPQSVGRDFYCENNQLTTLEGAPQSVGGNFDCYKNQLTSLVGAPKTIKGDFHCNNNQLTTLVGAPHSFSGSFYCENNQLTTLVGAPHSFSGSFYCDGNTVTKSTLKAIFALMKKGKGYEQALEEHWPKMGDVDRVLMYKEMPNLSPEETRKYKALATYNNIKDYL